jgi:putative tricarboxylic transport membrane protein
MTSCRLPSDLARRVSLFAAAFAFSFAAGEAASQPGWRPEKPVEIILPTAAGGANDQVARMIQKTLQDHKLVTTPIVIMNKAGGNQTLAAVYLRKNAKDPHYLAYSTSTVLTAEITGLAQQHYSDLAAIALLVTEHSVLSVHADSPIKTLQDLIKQLKSNPQALTFSIVQRGGSNHVALAQVVKTGGIDPRRLKIVVSNTNVESYLGLVGGHIQVVASSATAAHPFVQQGTARILAIAAPQRQPGWLAQVPTIREQGIDAPLITNWRGIFGAPGLSAAQIAFWEDAFTKMVATDDWKKAAEQYDLTTQFLSGSDFTKYLAAQYQATKSVLTDLGYAK